MMLRWIPGLSVPLALVLVGAPGPQIALGQPEPVPRVTPAGQVELARLVDLAAQRLGVNLQYDAASLKGEVTLRLAAPLSDRELWLLVNRTLAERGLTTVRGTGAGAFSIVKLADAAGLAPIDPAQSPQGLGLPTGYKTVVVRAHHRSAKELLDAAAKVLSRPAGLAQPIGDGGMLLISDLSPRVDQALELLRLVDVPVTGPLVKEIKVRQLSAPALAALVAQVAAKRELVSGTKLPGEVLAAPGGGSVLLICPPEHEAQWTGLITSLDQREEVATRSYNPRTFALKEVAALVEATAKEVPGLPPDDRWRLVQDELTGTLIITATPSQHESIAALMERLNSTPSAVARPVRSFILRNRSVEEIQPLLEGLLSAGIIGAGQAQDPGAQPYTPVPGTTPWPPPPGADRPATPSGPTPAFPLAPDNRSAPLPPASQPPSSQHTAPVTFTVDKGTNTLIAMGEPRLLAQIEELLRTLDVRQPQVMLEVLILSLTESQTLDLGVEIEQLVVSGDVRIRLASLFGLGSRGAGGDRTAGDGSGFTGVVLSPGDFSVIIRALQTINNGRSLSMPRVLVANNQQGTLDSVLDVPFTSTNASSTVTTTSFGGSRPAGTQVSIKPQIASGDHLLLDYSVSLSAFVGAAADPRIPPPRQENSIQSTATIPDGYTVAVGGIELASDNKGVSQVPGLGSIPVLGEAFKNRTKNASRSRFYVFITATVLRQENFEDLKYLSDQGVAAAGIDDGWPELEPRVIR